MATDPVKLALNDLAVTCKTLGLNISALSTALTLPIPIPIIPITVPINITLPIISGVPQVGQQISGSNGTWTNNPISYVYQWYRSGSLIAGANFLLYTPIAADIGNTLTFSVIAKNSSGLSLSATSIPTNPVLGLAAFSGPVFYVDSVSGNDLNTGTTQATAWQTLNKVNGTTFGPGSTILFKRGGMWRGQIKPSGGSNGGVSVVGSPLWWTTNGITYSTYGVGAMPLFLGSVDASSPSAWRQVGGNLWETVQTFPSSVGINGQPYNAANEIGNIIFLTAPTASGGVPIDCGFAEFTGPNVGGNPSGQGHWNFNTSTWRCEMWSTSNPGSFYKGIELAIDQSAVLMYSANYIMIGGTGLWSGTTSANMIGSGFEFRYFAGNAINGQPGSYFWMSGCKLSYIGGGNLGGKGTRYGDCISPLDNCNNWLVERCWMEQIYDGGMNAVQGINADSIGHDIVYRNNIVWKASAALFSMWGGALIYNIFVYNNTFVSNKAWCDGQRPNGNQNFGLSMQNGGISASTRNINLKNNAFVDIGNCSLLVNTFSDLKGAMTMDYNLWSKRADGSLTTVCATSGQGNQNLATWASTFPAEQHGLIDIDPKFTDKGVGNFIPLTDSPLRNAGMNLVSSGVSIDFFGNLRPTMGNVTIGAIQ